MTLTFDEYQDTAQGFARIPEAFPLQRLFYACTKLSGEAGEFNEKIGKILRASHSPEDAYDLLLKSEDALRKELGDVLWYVSFLAGFLGANLSDIAQGNLDKLAGRAERGTLHGDGDER